LKKCKDIFRHVSSLYVTFVFCFFSAITFSQTEPQAQNIFINNENQNNIDAWDIKQPSFEFHSSFKPYLSVTLQNYSDTSVKYLHYAIKNTFLSKTYNEGQNKRNQ
jgi:hypothetical protein